MNARRIAQLSAPALLVLALAACAPGGAPAGAPTAEPADPGSGAAGGGTAECLTDRTWVLDLDDLAQQLADNMTSNGMTATQSSGAGRQTFVMRSDGRAEASIASTFTLGVDAGDGVEIVVEQTHTGAPSGNWQLAGNTLKFTDWTSDYAIQNTVLINGVASDAPINLPADALDGTNMTITCEGDTLTTKAAISPFTQRWNAEN